MRIGIDFGTTRVVVAAADRGNYPLVNFEAPDGRVRDWFPSLLAVSGDKRVYGWEALQQQGKPAWTIVRSLKRQLKKAGPGSAVDIAGQPHNVSLLMTEMMMTLRRELMDKSTLGASKYDRLQVMLGVPANANSNQRFLTQEAARAAGFEVLGLLNEPSAAAVEFACRNSSDRKNRVKGGLLVYDLGGGTFDASLVDLGETEHFVVASTRFWPCWPWQRPESPSRQRTRLPGQSGTCYLTNAAKKRNRSIPTAARSLSIWSGFGKTGGKSPSAWTRSMNGAVLWWKGPAGSWKPCSRPIRTTRLTLCT